jgi:hypothetical protein
VNISRRKEVDVPIIVAGKLTLKPGCRGEFIEQSLSSISQARANQNCLDFSVSPDPIDQNRVNIYEKWLSREALDVFRSIGPESRVLSMVLSFDINEYEV